MRLRNIIGVLVLSLVALPLGAQTWEVYDSFDGPLLNPARWYSEYGEDRSALEYGRQIRNGWLELWMRGYGRSDWDSGQTQGINSMHLLDMTSFKGIKVKLTVIKAYCNEVPDPGWGDNILTGASFFNTGSNLPEDDVTANILIYGANSQTLSVGGEIVCGRYGNLGGVVLGSIKIGDPISIWIRWNPAVKQFFFGLQVLRKNQPPVEQGVTCDLADAGPPVDHKEARLGMSTWLTNSLTFQAYSELMVKIDQVSVLRGTL